MPSDIVAQTAQGTALSFTSNLLAQVLSSYKNDTPLLTFNLAPALKFGLFSIISNPPNILWQSALENAFPTNVPVVAPKSEKPKPTTTQISKTNVGIKFVLDMTIGAAINNLMFLVFMAYLNAPGTGPEGTWAVVQREVSEKFWPLVMDGYKLWPFVSLVSFLFVPVNRRVLLGCLVGVGWNIYLSLLVGS